MKRIYFRFTITLMSLLFVLSITCPAWASTSKVSSGSHQTSISASSNTEELILAQNGKDDQSNKDNNGADKKDVSNSSKAGDDDKDIVKSSKDKPKKSKKDKGDDN